MSTSEENIQTSQTSTLTLHHKQKQNLLNLIESSRRSGGVDICFSDITLISLYSARPSHGRPYRPYHYSLSKTVVDAVGRTRKQHIQKKIRILLLPLHRKNQIPSVVGYINMKKIILPIDAYREEILKSIKENPVTVITAETGAGKSTQVPQYLLEEGYDLVVTQPRRLAARSVATRVAQEMGQEIRQTIGYRTAVERVDSPQTRCLFCTDGLALVRELMGQNKGVLVLDEVHEWNENMEVLVAWVKSQIATGIEMRVVLMSATLEAEKLSAFFNNAPIISVPGRTFPVEDQMAGRDIETDVATLVAEGRNVLVFQPGQGEINETIQRLEAMKVPAIILPLHGQLTPQEQARCFAHYGKPKVVVSTNVAQTSVTIDDIDAVVDSGLERRIELVDGVEGLYLKPVSLADAKQRKGRAGRVKAGIYIDHCPSSSRPDFPIAEILRKRLDQTVLRLAIAGFDMEVMEFFHQPAKSDIHDAHETLIGLGCMTRDGKVTQTGRLVNKLPVSVKYGRMLVEADRLGVVNDILTVAAIMEMDGITVPPPSRNRPDRPDWRQLVPDEKESDIMAQLSVWQLARSMNESKMKESGISLRDYYRAKEIRQTLSEALKGRFQFTSNGNRENILKAVCAGMVDHLYHKQYGSYRNGDDTDRDLGSSSVVERSMPDWIVGLPFDLQIATKRGSMTLNLVSMTTKVNPMWLAEIAPHMVEIKTGNNPRWSSEEGSVVSTTQTYFNGTLVKEETIKDPDHTEASRILDEQSWNSWEKPEITIPDFSADASVEVPEIKEFVYATSAIDGSPLTTYGVVYNSGSWYGKWTRSVDEATRLRNEAVTKLADLRARWALRDSFLGEINQINKEREVVSLPKLEAKDDGFTCWSRTLDYTQENLDFVKAEVACKKIFDDLNTQREELGLSVLSLDGDGEFSLNGYKKLTPENLDLLRQTIDEAKERLEKEKQEKEDRAKLEVEFQKLNERRCELGMEVLTIDSDNEFSLNGYHKLTLENLQLIRDDITKEEQDIEEKRIEDEERIKRESEEKLKEENREINSDDLLRLLEKFK
jgi:HrpA-like RNA helicase